MAVKLPYDRKDYYSILEYLKLQAQSLSKGRWTDFNDSDIGTVLLKLMSMLADMNNYQTDKGISELYLPTVLDRGDALSLCKLIGYEPRHYLSAKVFISLVEREKGSVPDGTKVSKFTQFSDQSEEIVYSTLDDYYFQGGSCTIEAYQGTPKTLNYTISDVSTTGKISLPDYNIATNTVQLSISGQAYTQVENVNLIAGELGFSVHMSENKVLYIQLPSFWTDVISQSSNIEISYLLSDGASGKIGSNIISKVVASGFSESDKVNITNEESSTGGYDPESIEEIRISAPNWARTMNTIVTLNDFREVCQHFDDIADLVALDYNFESSGLVQPDDYYKVNIYVLPRDSDTIFKPEKEWTEDEKELNKTWDRQILTDIGDELRDYINERRLASLYIKYFDVTYFEPHLKVDVYMNQYDLKYSITADSVKNHILETYKRGNLKIGEPLFAPNIGADILDNYDYIEYCEVSFTNTTDDAKSEVDSKTFNNLKSANVSVEVHPYEKKL